MWVALDVPIHSSVRWALFYPSRALVYYAEGPGLAARYFILSHPLLIGSGHPTSLPFMIPNPVYEERVLFCPSSRNGALYTFEELFFPVAVEGVFFGATHNANPHESSLMTRYRNLYDAGHYLDDIPCVRRCASVHDLR